MTKADMKPATLNALLMAFPRKAFIGDSYTFDLWESETDDDALAWYIGSVNIIDVDTGEKGSVTFYIDCDGDLDGAWMDA